jgi:type IV secretion system protein VirB10
MDEATPTVSAAGDIRPLVAKAGSARAPWLFAAALLAVGGGIFYSLQMRRLSLENPSALTPRESEETMIASPPALVIPSAPEYAPTPGSLGPEVRMGSVQAPAASYTPSPATAPNRSYAPPPTFVPYSPGPAQMMPGPTYQAPPQDPDLAVKKPTGGRVQAHSFANPGMTVPQGAVIQAVMETALDSTRPGFARAIVSRDVMGFDGARVLIPKGSRLFGTYESDVSLGQKRALIQWERLTTPNGAQIDLDSPSADPLGRAGLKGAVNSHFFQRFSGAILQSVLDIGVRAASQKVDSNTVIVGLPGSTTQAATIQGSTDIKPTLKVKQGASVSVFVARDLDFSSVGG